MVGRRLLCSFVQNAETNSCACAQIAAKKSTVRNLRTAAAYIVQMLAICGFILLASQWGQGQTVSVSPGSLAFGVPTGTSGALPASASASVVVNISGATPSNPVTFTAMAAVTSGSSDFVVDGDSCYETGTFTSNNTCLISVHYNAGLAPATTLETAVLTISFTTVSPEGSPTPGSSTVNLSGAYGSILLFNETNIATPSSTTSFTNLYTIATNTLNLSCPASPSATLSGTPDGLGNVLVDNYITLATGSSSSSLTTVQGIESNYPPGNMCSGTGAYSDSVDDDEYISCFTQAYDYAAVLDDPISVLGLDPDTFAGTNTLLYKDEAGGIGLINIQNFFTSGPQTAQFTLLSSAAENYYGNSTLFLATSCSPGGLVSGGSVTGNPTTTNTATFDSNPGSTLSITDNTSQNAPTGGTTPVYTQIAVPQQLFYQLTENTSAAADVCLRSNAELDYTVKPPAPMCVGILIQCWDPTHTTLSGDNCDSSTPVGARDLYDFLKFASPDAPVDGTNFLYGPQTVELPTEPDACAFYMANPNQSGTIAQNGACATGTGPALLMGGDAWLCASGNAGSSTCSPLEPSSSGFNTTTSPSTQVYSEPNCELTGGLTNDACPFDTLVQFEGAADGGGGGKTDSKNSVFFLTANHPLPSATVTTNANAAGWVNSSTINANFTASQATYSPGSSNPPANGFMAAPIYSLTYGISTYPSLPDPTAVLPGDITLNASGTNANFGVSGDTISPLCPSAVSGPFSPPMATLSEINGIYNIHYYTTDCALAEGLIFNPTDLTTPTNDWASFPYVTIGVDTVAPTLGSCTATTSPVYNNWYSTNVTATCTVTDQDYNSNPASPPLTGSGFLPLVNPTTNGPQGSPSEVVTVYTDLAQGCVSTSATAGEQGPLSALCTNPPSLTVTDLAGNPVSGGVSAGPYMIDMQPPVITGPTLSCSTCNVNQPITATFACNDGTGSGVLSCTGAASSGVCGSGTVVSGGTITPTMTGTCTFTVTAVDNVGNPSMAFTNYTVILAAQTITFGMLSNQVYGTAPFAVNATASSGLAVSFASTTASVCTVSGNTVTLVMGGMCTIQATQAGNTSYAAAIPVSQSFTVTPEAQTISFGALPNQVYGTAPFAVSATASSGLAVSFASTTASVCTVSGNTVTLVMGGMCTIQATQAGNASYAAANPVSQSFTVTPESQTISFTSTAPASLGVGATYTPTATATSGLTVAITLDATSTGCTLSAGVVTGTAVGTCVIDANQAGNADYSAATQVQQKIPVTVAWTITPSSYFFGTLSLGQSASETFIVTNATATATAVKVSIPGSGDENGAGPNEIDPDDYVITSNSCTTVAANGGTCKVTVTWTPDIDDLPLYASGGSLAYLQVANSSKTVLVYATMTGKAEDPTIGLSPATTSSSPYNFGSTSGTETFTLTNNGPTPLYLAVFGAITISGSSDYSLASGTTCKNGMIIAANGTCTIAVTFKAPSKSSTVNATVTINSNAVTIANPTTISAYYIYLTGQ